MLGLQSIRKINRTYLLILVSRKRHLQGHHAICEPPLWLHQSIIELEFIAVYPVIESINMPRETLKLSNCFCMVTSFNSVNLS